MELERLAAQLKAFAHDRQEIVAIYLYGSQAQGRARPDSDVDLAILVRPRGQDLFDLELELDAKISRLPGVGETEVLVLNRAPVTMQFEVVSTGRLLHSHDEKFRTNWEVKMLGDYWDIRPFLQEYDRIFFKRLKEGFTDAQWREYYRARATLAGTH